MGWKRREGWRFVRRRRDTSALSTGSWSRCQSIGGNLLNVRWSGCWRGFTTRAKRSSKRSSPVVLDAFEHDAYWQIVEKIDAARFSDVAVFSEALAEFGLFDLAIVGRQAQRRKRLLEEFAKLTENPTTLEADVHRVLEKNLWLLEISGVLLSSNESIRRVVDEYLSGKYRGDRQSKRPDLLIAADIQGASPIVELKRPSHVITRDDDNSRRSSIATICRINSRESPSCFSERGRRP